VISDLVVPQGGNEACTAELECRSTVGKCRFLPKLEKYRTGKIVPQSARSWVYIRDALSARESVAKGSRALRMEN